MIFIVQACVICSLMFMACLNQTTLSSRDSRHRMLCGLKTADSRLDLLPRGILAPALRIVTDNVASTIGRVRSGSFKQPIGLAEIMVQSPLPTIGMVIFGLGSDMRLLREFWSLGQSFSFALDTNDEHAKEQTQWLESYDASIARITGGVIETRHAWKALPISNSTPEKEAVINSLEHTSASSLGKDWAIKSITRQSKDRSLETTLTIIATPENDVARMPLSTRLNRALARARGGRQSLMVIAASRTHADILRHWIDRHEDEFHLVPLESTGPHPMPPAWWNTCASTRVYQSP